MDHFGLLKKNNPGLCKKHAGEVLMARKYFHSSSSFTLLTIMFCELSAAKIVLFYLLSPLNLVYCSFIFLKAFKIFQNLEVFSSQPFICLLFNKTRCLKCLVFKKLNLWQFCLLVSKSLEVPFVCREVKWLRQIHHKEDLFILYNDAS